WGGYAGGPLGRPRQDRVRPASALGKEHCPMSKIPHGEGGNLVDLGPGAGSAVERVKLESQGLRGRLAEELAEETSRFSDAQVQLIKFHGIYQQEDRDARQ